MPRLSELRSERIAKLKKIRKAGINPYPARSKRDFFVSEFTKKFSELIRNKKEATLAGRIQSIRKHGKIAFIDLDDASGKIQLFVSQEHMKQADFFLDVLDEGDIIEARGQAYLPKSNEKSLRAGELRILTKTLRPLPKEHFGFKDNEERFRKRYVDLLLNPEVRERFEKAAIIMRELRKFLDDNGFIEVKTPVLQPLAGGALAKPFWTHHNALDMNLVLRIAPELYLKRLIVGGFQKVYELGDIFRNEGVDRDHNPEFLMLELYWAYQDWEGLMKFTEDWMYHVARSVSFNLPKPPWPRKEFSQLFKEKTGLMYEEATEKDLFTYAKNNHILVSRALSKGKIADEILKKTVRHELKDPMFLTKIPVDISPFAKKMELEDAKTERFIPYINGLELVNGFSELNDPIDQDERFQNQQEMKKRGDEEITEYDKDYVQALEYGMPPTAGLGLGVTRFIMLLTGASSVREAMLFPLMRPKS